MTVAMRRMEEFCFRVTGLVVQEVQYDYLFERGVIQVPYDGVEDLLHEICHWVLAAPSRRHRRNYGVNRLKIQGAWEEIGSGWIEDHLYALAGVKRPHSSVDVYQYQKHPHLKDWAFRRWRKIISEEQDREIASILTSDGGWYGAYDGVWYSEAKEARMGA